MTGADGTSGSFARDGELVVPRPGAQGPWSPSMRVVHPVSIIEDICAHPNTESAATSRDAVTAVKRFIVISS